MTNHAAIKVLFVDIGGVLLTNGWDHIARRNAAETFGLDFQAMDERHHLTFDTYEEGKITLHEYLQRVVFHTERPFSLQQFKDFMFRQSRPYPEMIDLITRLKQRHKLKVAAVSNEGRELTVYRIKKFGLATFIDSFVASCFVHYRKPDEDIYRIALDITQATPAQVVYIEDRPMFVEVARGLGIHGVIHTDLKSTSEALHNVGLAPER